MKKIADFSWPSLFRFKYFSWHRAQSLHIAKEFKAANDAHSGW
jgi:hypothetical protein